jgi:hypothetical protein
VENTKSMWAKLTDYARAHPVFIRAAAGILLLLAADMYHKVNTYADTVEQLNASEYFGG